MSHAGRRLAILFLTAIFAASWSAASAYSILSLAPRHQVYVLEPAGGLTLRGASCVLGSPVYVAVPRQSSGWSHTIIASALGGYKVNGFRAKASCGAGRYVAIAGSYHGSPAILLAGLLGPHMALEVEGLVWGSFNTVSCTSGWVTVAGTSSDGLVVAALSPERGLWWSARLPLYDEPRGTAYYGGRVYVLLASGRVVSVGPEAGPALLYEPAGGGSGRVRTQWQGLAAGPGGVWLYGSARVGNSTWAALAPLSGGEAILLRSRTHGGRLLAAYWDGSRWTVYYRPGSYWDSILESTASGGFSGARLLWTGEHVVSHVGVSSSGVVETGTVVWGKRLRVVIACLNGTRDADYWLGSSSVMHVALIPEPERIETSNIRLPDSSTRIINSTNASIQPITLKVDYSDAIIWGPVAARARWWGPLYAATWADLGIVFFALVARGLSGAGDG